MRRRWTKAVGLLALTSLARPAIAQSLSIEEQPEEPSPAPSQPKPPPSPTKPPVIVMPVAKSTPLEYPPEAKGEASVALELTLTADGAVTKATAIEGDEPFVSQAIKAAGSWTFEPATRDGKPIPAKIRFLVRFVPPRELQEPEPVEATPAPATTPRVPGAPAKPAEPVYEITVLGERAPIRHELARVEIARMPGAFGDPYRAIEALPGVVPIVSGLPYFYVRGAPPGNIGYFFDGIPVPFLYHFAAGPGVFHPAFVERVDLYPGAYPVRYGRYAGAIVAGEMAPPGYKWRGEWNIRILDSGAMVEAPFADGRGSVMLGGRFSYTGFVISLIAPEVSVGYWDYQARARYDLDAKNSVEVVGFGSNDYVSQTDEVFVTTGPNMGRYEERENTLVDVGFHRLDLRWDHQLGDGKWRNALMLGRDRTGLGDEQISVYNHMIGLRSEFSQSLQKNMRLRAGADLLFEVLEQNFSADDRSGVDERPSSMDPGAAPLPGDGTMAPNMMPPIMMGPIGMQPEPIDEGDDESDEAEAFGFKRERTDFAAGLYADVVWDIAPRVQVTPGLRLDLYALDGEVALGIDPRLTVEFEIRKKLKLVHGLALVHQPPSFVVPVPGFKPSLQGGLQTAVQYSAGVQSELPAGFSGSAAVFQTAFHRMSDLISLAQLEQTEPSRGDEGESLSDYRTDGHAYGFELMVRRSLARNLGGFLSYTLSHSRRFMGRLSGPATTDRTHVLNLAASYDLGKNWRFGGRLMTYTGIPAEVAYLEAARHPPRTPAFWRLDFKLEKRWYIKRPNRWWGFNIEMLNTTLNKEQLEGSCNAYDCRYEEIGPVSIPSIAFEGAL